jgi:hypothetical protein
MEIRGHGGHIKIEVQGYERRRLQTRTTLWLVAGCKVAAGDFSCTFGLALVTSDFARFLSVMVFGSEPGKTNQNQSTRRPRKRLTLHI